jgi:hypothetical protein
MLNQFIQFIQSLNEWGIILALLIIVAVLVFIVGFIQVHIEMRSWKTFMDNDFKTTKK